MLEAQVASGQAVSTASIRDRDLSQSFGQRALVPVVLGAGRLGKRLTPIDARDKIAKRLLLAGSPRGWDAERVMAFKVIGGITGLVGGLLLSSAAGLSGAVLVAVVGLLTFVGFVLPDAILSKLVQDRQKEVRKTLSDTLDLLTISVEAGLSLNAALTHVVQSTPGVLAQEFARMLQEVQLGVSRSDAFRHLAERTDVDEMNSFALAMIQADVFGVSISNVLRTQAQQLRIKRRQRAETLAQKTPVKIVFPLILCILPALFVVIVGPGAIRIFQSLLST
jgi:tight adherence protein C